MLNWANKYEPNYVNKLLVNKNIKTRIKLFNDFSTGLIFAGKTGIGKTVIINLIVKNHYKENTSIYNFDHSFKSETENLSLLKQFCEKKEKKNRAVIIDNADIIDSKVQKLIVGLIAQNNKIKIILACCDLHNIIKAFQSRCDIIVIQTISKKKLTERLNEIIIKEKCKFSAKAIKFIVKISCGNIRKAIIMLQQASLVFDKTGIKEIKSLHSLPSTNKIKDILKKCKQHNIKGVINDLHDLINFGYSQIDLCTVLFNVLVEHGTENKETIEKIKKVSQTLFFMSKGAVSDLQLIGCFINVCDNF